MSVRPSARVAAAVAASALIVTLVAVAAGPQQERPGTDVQAVEKEKPAQDATVPEVIRDGPLEEGDRPKDEVTAQIEKWFNSYDLKPHPLPSIPEDPPPHEGAMIDLPLVVEPPDNLIVEVLETLPGRPISGERLVRPDGVINLGFYGDVYVRGLTLAQIKVAIIKRLRTYLDDRILGLRWDPIEVETPTTVRSPHLPQGNPFEKAAPTEKDSGSAPARPLLPGGSRPRFISPEHSTRVLVDISSYNSMPYYVTGDVLIPGKLPCTGKETVLDALQYASGLLPTAEPKDIRLVRPGRNGKPARVYKVDLEAIQDRGDVSSNYQIFPGDRLIVGRNEVVKKTIEIDRLNAPIQAIVSSIQQNANMIQALGGMRPDEGDQMLRDLVEFWSKQLSQKGDLKFDEDTLREVLLRQLRKAPAAPGARPAPRAR